jgi:hypothetical protein
MQRIYRLLLLRTLRPWVRIARGAWKYAFIAYLCLRVQVAALQQAGTLSRESYLMYMNMIPNPGKLEAHTTHWNVHIWWLIQVLNWRQIKGTDAHGPDEVYVVIWYMAVSHWLPTAAVRVRARVRSCGIWGGQKGTGTGFLRVLRFPLPIFIPPIAPQTPSFIIWGWDNRPVVATVPSGLTPLIIIIILIK